MKNKELYHKTIDILVKAYLNDTLEQRNCMACAVGNMVAAGLGIKIINDKERCPYKDLGGLQRFAVWDADEYEFDELMVRFLEDGIFHSSVRRVMSVGGRIDIDDPKVQKQIKATGYKIEDLALIEMAFEKGRGDSGDEKIYNSLMEVVNILGQIHEADKETIQVSKLMFVK
jgi:hypothetical protein